VPVAPTTLMCPYCDLFGEFIDQAMDVMRISGAGIDQPVEVSTIGLETARAVDDLMHTAVGLPAHPPRNRPVTEQEAMQHMSAMRAALSRRRAREGDRHR